MTPSAPRNARIDLLRGVAILLVMLLHFTLTYRLGSSPLTALIPPKALRAILLNGNFAVTMFFVVSGYLITSISMGRYGSLGGISIGRFYALRFARILPCLLLALTLVLAFGWLGLPSFDNVVEGRALPRAFFLPVTASVLTFWHNALMGVHGYFNYCLNVYWSLSVEEVFYLAFPLACALLRRRRLLLGLCLLAAVVGPLYRGAHRDDEIRFMYGYLACFDAIAIGCATAILADRFDPTRLRSRWVQTAAALGTAAVYLWGIDGHEAFGFTLIALGTAVLVLGEPGRPAASLPGRLLRWLGRHSYELYLFHILVLGFLRDAVGRSQLSPGWKLPWLLLYLALSAALAAAVARVLSEPANAALRRRFLPRD